MATVSTRNWLSFLRGTPLSNQHPAQTMASLQASRLPHATACAQETRPFEVKPMQVSIAVLQLTALCIVLKEACTVTLFLANTSGVRVGLPMI